MVSNKRAARLLFKAALRVAAQNMGGVGGVSKGTSIKEVKVKNNNGDISVVEYNKFLKEVITNNE